MFQPSSILAVHLDVTTRFSVLKIDRIQNPLLWKTLQMKKRTMEQKNGHQNNENILFHGTSEDTVLTINENGFNRSYAGKNGEKFRSSKRLLLYLHFVRTTHSKYLKK